MAHPKQLLQTLILITGSPHGIALNIEMPALLLEGCICAPDDKGEGWILIMNIITTTTFLYALGFTEHPYIWELRGVLAVF